MTTLNYSTTGLLTSITDADSKEWDYDYDSSARITLIVDPLTNETAFTYGAGNRVARARQNERSNALDHLRLRRARRPAEQLRDHVVGHLGRALVPYEPQHPQASGDGFGRVRLRFRVGEQQSLEVARRPPEHRKRDVTAHRDAADHRFFNM